MAEMNKTVAAKLWDALTITIDRFHGKIVVHPNSVFLGYADVTLSIPSLPGFALKLRGIEVKNLKGNAHIDFPSERGADGEFYPQFFPKSAEMRAVLTTAMFADQRIMDTVEAAATAPPEADSGAADPVEATADNPFSGS